MKPTRKKAVRAKRTSRLSDFLKDFTAAICDAADSATEIVGHLEPLILRLFAFSCMLYALGRIVGTH
jgi:hypothetical protein